MIFKAGDGQKSGPIAGSVKSVLTKMGWVEYSREAGHSKDEVNLIFSKRPKISDLHAMFPIDSH